MRTPIDPSLKEYSDICRMANSFSVTDVEFISGLSRDLIDGYFINRRLWEKIKDAMGIKELFSPACTNHCTPRQRPQTNSIRKSR